jgi:hypothetical protein
LRLINGNVTINNKIIGENIGGQFNEKFKLGPRILKYNNNSKEFITKFLNNKKLSEFFIGYYYDDKFNNHCNENYRNLYFKKTRGENKSFENSSMSDNNNIILGYDINNNDIFEFYDKVKEQCIIDKILKIDLKNKLLKTSNNNFKYDKIINTLPVNIFNKLSGINNKVEYERTYFFKIKKNEINYNDIYDYIYFPEQKFEYHRITKIDDEFCCIEIMEKNIRNFLNIKEDFFILNNGHLKSDNITIFSILDVSKRMIQSYYFDISKPDSEVVLLDEFEI